MDALGTILLLASVPLGYPEDSPYACRPWTDQLQYNCLDNDIRTPWIAVWNGSLTIPDLRRQLSSWQQGLLQRPRARALLSGAVLRAADHTVLAIAAAETSLLRLQWNSVVRGSYRASKWRQLVIWFVLPMDEADRFTFICNGCDSTTDDCPVPAQASGEQFVLSRNAANRPAPMYDGHGLPHGVVPLSETVWSWSAWVDVQFTDTAQTHAALYMYAENARHVVYKTIVSIDRLLVNLVSPRLQQVTVMEM
jgi:hypothetical protein